MQTDEICSNTAAAVCVHVLLTLQMFSHSCGVRAILLGRASVTQVTQLAPPSPPPPLSLPFIFMFSASVVFSSAEAGRQCDTQRKREKRKAIQIAKKKKRLWLLRLAPLFLPTPCGFWTGSFRSTQLWWSWPMGSGASKCVCVSVLESQGNAAATGRGHFLTYWWADLFLMSGPTLVVGPLKFCAAWA